jgi:hypothetical protein
MGYAMDDGICADCNTLQQAVLDATIRHIQTESRLAIAKLQHDSPKARALKPVVEHLLQERSAAVRAYQQHIDTHAKGEAASAGMT